MFKGYLAIAAAAALWGISGTLAKFMFRQAVDPALLSNFRMTLSFLILLAGLAVFRRDLLQVPPGMWGHVAVWSLLGLMPVQYTYMLAIDLTNVATALFIQYLAPVFTALYSVLVERKPLGRSVASALPLAIGGSALLVLGSGTGLRLSAAGLGAAFVSCVLFAGSIISGRGMMARINSWTLLVWGLGMGAAVWNIVQPPWTTLSRVQDPALWALFAYVATLATIAPFGLFLWGLRHVPPTPAVLTAMLEPVVGTAAAWFALGEGLTTWQTVGGSLILVAVAAIQWPKRKTPNLGSRYG